MIIRNGEHLEIPTSSAKDLHSNCFGRISNYWHLWRSDRGFRNDNLIFVSLGDFSRIWQDLPRNSNLGVSRWQMDTRRQAAIWIGRSQSLDLPSCRPQMDGRVQH
jgi:hypothetical protein